MYIFLIIEKINNNIGKLRRTYKKRQLSSKNISQLHLKNIAYPNGGKSLIF